ncbi:MAG: DUF3108 domain-containing protein [Saprospiraceae bacterium]|nr:DUF3108 domain-containing protein [Saprospiraceae bacterium]
MKAFKFFAPVLCLFSMAFVQPHAQQPVETTIQNFEPCRSTNNTFQNGEVLTYKIYYNLNFVWVPAGEVTFKVWDEGAQYHYQAIGKTYESYEWFFTVKDRYDSWVDKNTLLPNYSEREVNEGDYHIFEKIAFNQSGRKMTVWRSPKRGEAEKKTEHGVTDCVHDVLSSLYNLRTIDFASQAPGTAVPFRIFMDQEEFPLKMRYMGKDARKKVYGMGRYNTLKFQPDVIAGNTFDEDTKMTVWVSDDQNRIPLLIESPVSVGSVKMVIKEYRGLKYDFTAKVK